MISMAQGQRSGRGSRRRRPPADEPPGDGEDAQAESFRFPAAGGAGQREHLRPGEELAGQGDDLAPELVLRVALQAAGSAGRCPWRSGSGPRTVPVCGALVPGRRADRGWRRWPGR